MDGEDDMTTPPSVFRAGRRLMSGVDVVVRLWTTVDRLGSTEVPCVKLPRLCVAPLLLDSADSTASTDAIDSNLIRRRVQKR
jgi:hypothetical protein